MSVDFLEALDTDTPAQERPKLKRKVYERELARLQEELVRLQRWIKHRGLKVVVIFEGRDAAGKGGVIKRITERLNPRIVRVVALGTPATGRRPSGGSSGTWPSCRRPARWSSSTGVGTTAGSWSP